MAYTTNKVRVISRITGYDGDPLTGAIVGLIVTLDIFDPNGIKVIDGQAMSWHVPSNPAIVPYWYWDWPTGSNPPGRYKTEVHAVGGPDDIDAFDFGQVRLLKRPSKTGV